MFTLGGWLFADLLLGLAMLFAVANTVGQEPPTPTPTASPDFLATSEADLAFQQSSSQQTQEALQAQIDESEISAQQTQVAADQVFAAATEEAAAEATRAAMDKGERATADAQATENAVSAQATYDALATQQAQSNQSVTELNNELATNVARATEAAEALSAAATEQAEVEAVATENASTGANAQATSEAAQQSAANAEATAQAAQASAATTEAELANAQATSAAASESVANAQATSEAAGQQLADAQATSSALNQQIQLNSLDPNAQIVTFSVDINGLIAGNDDAMEEARSQLERALAPYVNGQDCRIGFVNISSGAGSVGQGVQASEVIAGIIQSDFGMLIPEAAEGDTPQLASNAIAFTGAQSQGQVELQLFLSAGCEPAS
jgi:chemotaxis protein histidine kinase CheA